MSFGFEHPEDYTLNCDCCGGGYTCAYYYGLCPMCYANVVQLDDEGRVVERWENE